MLSLTFGGGITDNSVAAIVANCQRLELLDLSGYACLAIQKFVPSSLRNLFLY